MIAVIIEPAMLAVPPVAESEDEIESIITRITSWSRYVLDGGIVRVAQMSDTTEVLATSKCWPSSDNISALLDMYNLRHVYTPKEVSRLVNTILERALIVRDLIGFEVSSCVPDAPTAIDYQSDDLRGAGDRARSTILSSDPHVFLAPPVKSADVEVFFSAQVEAFLSGKDGGPFRNLPAAIGGNISLAETPQCVCRAITAEQLWDKALNSTDVHFAISLRALELSASVGMNLTIEDVPPFAIGSEFLSSLAQTQSGANSRFGHVVLEHAARVVLGHPKNSLDIFASGPRSISSQQRVRTRDGAGAYRTHVTKGAEGLRLVVWQHQSGMYEFANLSRHGDISISDGNPSLLARASWRCS